MAVPWSLPPWINSDAITHLCDAAHAIRTCRNLLQISGVQKEFALLIFEPHDLQTKLKSLGFATDLVEVADQRPPES